MPLQRRSMRHRRRDPAQTRIRRHVDIDHFGNLEHQNARVAKSPCNERNRKIAMNRHGVLGTANCSFDRKIMGSSMQQHETAHRDRKFALWVAVTYYLLRSVA